MLLQVLDRRMQPTGVVIHLPDGPVAVAAQQPANLTVAVPMAYVQSSSTGTLADRTLAALALDHRLVLRLSQIVLSEQVAIALLLSVQSLQSLFVLGGPLPHILFAAGVPFRIGAIPRQLAQRLRPDQIRIPETPLALLLTHLLRADKTAPSALPCAVLLAIFLRMSKLPSARSSALKL